MRRPVLAILLTLTLLGAGCLGAQEGDVDAQSADDAPVDAGPAFDWTHEERDGTASGANLVVVAVTQGTQTESFRVPEGTNVTHVNVTTDGGELQLELYPPGCDRSQGGGDECADEVTTQDGEAHWMKEAPTAGSWTVYLFKGDPGAADVPYTMVVDQLVPQEDDASSDGNATA